MNWSVLRSIMLKVAYPVVTGIIIGAQQYFADKPNPETWVLTGLLFGVANAVLSSVRKTFIPFS